MGLVCVVLKLCVPVESKVTVFTLEEVRLPKVFGQSDPSVDRLSASVAVEGSRRRFASFDQLLLISCKGPTLLMNQESVDELLTQWRPPVMGI